MKLADLAVGVSVLAVHSSGLLRASLRLQNSTVTIDAQTQRAEEPEAQATTVHRYVNVGNGLCADSSSKHTNFYYKWDVTHATCRSQCDQDSQCIAYTFNPDEGCQIHAPASSSSPAGWDWYMGSGAEDVSTVTQHNDYMCYKKQATASTTAVPAATALVDGTTTATTTQGPPPQLHTTPLFVASEATVAHAYVNIGKGMCRGPEGKLTNYYYNVQATHASCRSQCDYDNQCIAYAFVSVGGCGIYAPAASSAPDGWKWQGGTGSQVVSTVSLRDGYTCYVKQANQTPPIPPQHDDSCFYSQNGQCEEPKLCDYGTDCSDCNNCPQAQHPAGPTMNYNPYVSLPSSGDEATSQAQHQHGLVAVHHRLDSIKALPEQNATEALWSSIEELGAWAAP